MNCFLEAYESIYPERSLRMLLYIITEEVSFQIGCLGTAFFSLFI
jgi:hypothetical protein